METNDKRTVIQPTQCKWLPPSQFDWPKQREGVAEYPIFPIMPLDPNDLTDSQFPFWSAAIKTD